MTGLKVKQLISILEQYEPEDTVTVVYWNGKRTELADLLGVDENAGPSLYAAGWKGGTE